jgi:hypothetical protein
MNIATKEPAFVDEHNSPIRAVLEKDGTLADGYSYGEPASSLNLTEAEVDANLGIVRMGLTKTTWGGMYLTKYKEFYLSVSEAKELIRGLQKAVDTATFIGDYRTRQHLQTNKKQERLVKT